MPIFTASLAVAACAAGSAAAIAPLPSVPPLLISVAVAPDIPPHVVPLLLAEADGVWQAAGVRFIWQRTDHAPEWRHRIGPVLLSGPAVLRVVIARETGTSKDASLPLGWIGFDDATTPDREIHLSFSNALALLEDSSAVVGTVANMPRLRREILLARAMGRALAHEVGHYLLASKVHTTKGLMRAMHTAAEFFGSGRERFTLDVAERARVAQRFTSIYMASRG